MTTHVEMSRPYFKREMRVGRRVIFLWNEVERFGEVCEDCHSKATPEGEIIEGVIFTDEHCAAAFDLDWVQFDSPAEKSITTFQSWDEAQAWVVRP